MPTLRKTSGDYSKYKKDLDNLDELFPPTIEGDTMVRYDHGSKAYKQFPINNSYNVNALRNVLLENSEDSMLALRINKRIAQLYCIAYDDDEFEDMTELMDDDVVFASIWGASMGPRSAKVVASEERERLVLNIDSPLRPLTANTFYRTGYLHYTRGYEGEQAARDRQNQSAVTNAYKSVSGMFGWGKLKQYRFTEHLVVQKGFVVSRTMHCDFQFNFGKMRSN